MGTERQMLRKQMELLAEQSKGATDIELAKLSVAMCEVYKALKRNDRKDCLLVGVALFFAVCLYSLICILVHI